MQLETISNRLKEVMESRKLKQVDILELCKPISDRYGVIINKVNISQYVMGEAEPNGKKLAVLGIALDVNEAWLMGFDVPKERIVSLRGFDHHVDKVDFRDTLSQKILGLVKEHDKTLFEISLQLGINFSEVLDWLNSDIMISRLIVLADYLNVSIDYILGRTDKPSVNEYNFIAMAAHRSDNEDFSEIKNKESLKQLIIDTVEEHNTNK